MFIKIRNWLICALAGKSCVVINAHIYGEVRTYVKGSKYGIFVNNILSKPASEPPTAVLELGKYERRK